MRKKTPFSVAAWAISQAICLSMVVIFPLTSNAQLGQPQILSPVGPSPQYPQYSWTEVQGATQYKVTKHTVRQVCGGGIEFYENKDEVGIVDAKPRCSHGNCGFRLLPNTGWPDGVSSPTPPYIGGYIHCARDVNGALIVFTWKVQARNGTSEGPESAPASYSLAEAPPPPPQPPPLQDSYTVTCVFKTGSQYWAWYNGLFGPFVNSYGQPNQGVVNKTFTFSTAPFQNCSGLVNNATPIASAKFAVTNVAVCTNLISGVQETFINSTCPQENASPVPYRSSRVVIKDEIIWSSKAGTCYGQSTCSSGCCFQDSAGGKCYCSNCCVGKENTKD